MKATEK